MPMQQVFPRLSHTPGTIRLSGPELGQHNHDVFTGLLGLTDIELEELRQKGVI
jgi:formyl-CoA transferase